MNSSDLASMETFSPDFWKTAWEKSRRASFLKSTQKNHPERWEDFYNKVSHLWRKMTGSPGQTGGRVADLIISRGLARPGQEALDVGSGPGTLALPLAERGVNVAALDLSPGMLEALRREASRKGVGGIKTLQMDWREFEPSRPYDLAAACFFPQALNPAGLRRLESWSRGYCLLLLGDGRDCFPLRREIWRRVMEEPSPDSGFHLTCALNYLVAAGRRPSQEHLSWSADLDLPVQEVKFYFENYFAIFNKNGARLQEAIAKTLAPHTTRGMVRLSGGINLAALWWKAPRRPAGPDRG